MSEVSVYSASIYYAQKPRCRRLYSSCYEMRYMLKIESTLERVLRCRVVYPIISSRTLPTRMKHLKTMQGDTS